MTATEFLKIVRQKLAKDLAHVKWQSAKPERPYRRAAVGISSTVAIVCLTVGLSVPAPAQAVGMMSVKGNISCTAAPQLWIGTTATARGSVEFQLNKLNNTGQINTVSLGYSAAYAPWGWKWWNTSAGNFYAYGYTSIGNVTAINRYCMAY